jgi:ligand-binding sensor domain-containing protein
MFSYTNTNFINDIVGDSLNLYCATQGGFSIFSINESSYTDVFTNTEGLSVNRVSCLVRDKWGQIWIGTYRGLAIFNPSSKTIQSYRSLGTAEQDIITCLESAGDTMLIGTENGLFVVDTRGTSSIDDDVVFQPNLPMQFSCKIFSLGVLDYFWVGMCPGIIKLNRNLQSYTTYPHPLGDSVKAMTVVSDSLYIVTETGMSKYNGTNFNAILSFPQNFVVFDLKYNDNKFYIATQGGLISYDRPNMQFITYDDTRAIFISNGLWVGIGGLIWFGGGLHYYNNGIWHTFESRGLASNNVCCAISDTNGTIYAMHYPTFTYDFKKISYKGVNSYWQVVSDTLINTQVGDVDKENNAWFGHWALDVGLSKYDHVTNTWSLKTWSGYRGVIGAFGIDGNDIKWTYNQYNTIIAVNQEGQEAEFAIPGLSRPERGGYEFAFDAQNRVWLGTSVGLVMIDYNNTLTDLSDDTYKIIRQGLPDQEVSSVTVDAKNRVWCATARGAAVLEGDSFQVYNATNSQIISNNVKRIKADDWGNIWFLCLEGLSQYNIYTKEWAIYTPDNSSIIPNLEADDKFYQWLFINEKQGFLLISTKEGVSQFFYKTPRTESLTQILIYPNPFIASEHQVITFDSLPRGAVINIYTLDGKFLTRLEANSNFSGLRWNPGQLSSGIYFAVITTDKKSLIAKFAIIR